MQTTADLHVDSRGIGWKELKVSKWLATTAPASCAPNRYGL